MNYLQTEHRPTCLPSKSTYAAMTEPAAHAQVLRKLTKRKIFLLSLLSKSLR